MKKIYLALPLLALAMTACDPSKFDLGSPDGNTSTSTIESAITITQVDADGNPAADGNYFTYTTSPALPVQIFNYNSEGKEVSLAHGPKGSFSIVPKRGQDPNQTFYVRVANHDGSMSEITKTYNVYVPTELSPEIKYLASNSGSKKWVWDTSVLTHADLVKNSLSAVLTSGGAANLKCFGMTAKAANMAIPMAIPLRQVKAILVHT